MPLINVYSTVVPEKEVVEIRIALYAGLRIVANSLN
jgi:hypothetical protein